MVSKKRISKKLIKNENKAENSKKITDDPRFSHVTFDPKYRDAPVKNIKIHLDSRFKSALVKESFNCKPVLDPRGRPRKYGTKENLDKFYDVESSEESEEDSEEDETDISDEEMEDKKENITNTKDSETSDEDLEDSKIKNEKFMKCLLDPEHDLARGDDFFTDDSSDDDSTTTEEEFDTEFEWGELDTDAKWDHDGNEVEETNRFAVCDMDWDRIKAIDLMVLFKSFAPTSGHIEKVTIYPSEFGKARLEEEERIGPPELVKLAAARDKSRNDLKKLEKIEKGTLEETDEPSPEEIEALRRYQRNRLRYYYAVVVCDSVETAKTIYKACDRTNFELAGITLDLRYIPSDMEFDEMPHDVCERAPEKYESDPFITSALLNVTPTLTWDEDDKQRRNILSNAMGKATKNSEYDTEALKNFIASSDSEESTEEKEEDVSDEEEIPEDRVAKFRALIAEIDGKEEKRQESQINLEAVFSDDENKSELEEESPEETEEDPQTEKSLTPFEKYLMKRKEKRKQKKLSKKKTDEENESEDDSETKTKINSDSKKGSKKRRKSKTKTDSEISNGANSDLALLVMDEEKEDKKHFDMRKILEDKDMKKKKKTKPDENDEEENFQVDSTDPRFAALFTDVKFNLDPSHPKYDGRSLLTTSTVQKQKKRKLKEIPNENEVSNSIGETDAFKIIKKFKSKSTKLK